MRAVFKKSRLVGRLGSGIQVSVSFAKFPAWWVGYGQEPGRVSASFHIFALTAGGNAVGGEGNCAGGGMSGGSMSEGGNVLHWALYVVRCRFDELHAEDTASAA